MLLFFLSFILFLVLFLVLSSGKKLVLYSFICGSSAFDHLADPFVTLFYHTLVLLSHRIIPPGCVQEAVPEEARVANRPNPVPTVYRKVTY